MPPDAISRSRTYFPKIWGNTRAHRTALFSFLLFLLTTGCRTVPGPEVTHTIRARFVAGCVPPGGPGSARLDLTAAGDFDPSPDAFRTLAGDDENEPLVIPAATEAVVLTATDRFSAWSGLGTPDEAGNTSVALWSTRSACEIPSPSGSTYPADTPGQALGVTADGRTLLMAGGEGASQSRSALVVDLGTGVATEVRGGLRSFRAGSTVTSFGDGLLVAGGYDPSNLEPLPWAEVFDIVTGRFESDRISLERGRRGHGAVTLESGETLLVGGVGADGKLIGTLEVVVPRTRAYRIDQLTELEWPRQDPTVLRLSDGTVFVGGGSDGSDSPRWVDSLEWLSADAARTVRKTPALSDASTPVTVHRAFIAMPGAGVLAAGGCELRAGATLAEQTACDSACGDGGCPTRKVLWITREGAVTVLDDELDVDAPHPVLVAGSDGRPWLVCDAPGAASAAGSPKASAVRRFDPFQGRFVEAEEGAPAPTGDATHFVRADAGLFVWLGRDAADGNRVALSGFRHGTRGPFASNVSPLISVDTTGVALDRPPDGVFDADRHAVTLSEGGATLAVTDATYADVHLAITVVSGAPPLVRLGTKAFGPGDCSWPASTPPGSYTARVDRLGDRVVLTLGTSVRDCEGPTGRVSVELAAGRGDVTIGSLMVTRARAP